MVVENSVIAKDIQSSPQLRTRVEAILRMHFWATPSMDPRQFIPLDDVMWAVASNATVQQFVATTMAASDRPDMTMPAIDQVTDNDLSYIILTDAWPRLFPPATNPPSPGA